jgi:hypothetical protein
MSNGRRWADVWGKRVFCFVDVYFAVFRREILTVDV